MLVPVEENNITNQYCLHLGFDRYRYILNQQDSVLEQTHLQYAEMQSNFNHFGCSTYL